MTLRARLTLMTTVILLLSSVLLGIAFYATAARIQYDSIDRNLRASIAVERINGLIGNPRPVPADVYSTVAIVLVDAAGRTQTLRPAGYGASPLALPALDAASVAAAQQGPVTLEAGTAFRAVATTRNGRGDTVVALTPLAEVDAQLSRLRDGSALAVLLVTALGALLAWLVIGRALRPVDAMAQAAQAIADGDLERRVPSASADTELGRLSVALNTMIASLTSSITEVRASEARLRAFVSDASHELRTPVTVIRGYSELLARSPREHDELESRALDRMTQEVTRLEHLLTQLLALQRASDPDAPASSAMADIGAVMSSVFESFADLNPDRDLSINVESCEVPGTEQEWAAVAGNLTQNIERYTPEGSAVHLSVRRDGRSCVVIVDDAGPGIPLGSRVEMLDRFTRLDQSRSTASGGSGLGLSIVRAIVERHGGRIELEDSPIGGLRVRIAIPSGESPTRASESVG